MSRLRFTLTAVDSPIVLERRIKSSINYKIDKVAKLTKSRSQAKIEEVIRLAILNCQEVQSLNGEQLQFELGVTSDKVRNTVHFIIKRLIETMVIDIRPFSIFGNVMRGSITLKIFPNILVDELINFPDASFITSKTSNIEWLKWLLTLGDKIIVRQYFVDLVNSTNSRTGGAVMRKSKKMSWRVPPQFSGVQNNNFITRALDDSADLIAYHLINEFLRSI
jgi:hypothetical protein